MEAKLTMSHPFIHPFSKLPILFWVVGSSQHTLDTRGGSIPDHRKGKTNLNLISEDIEHIMLGLAFTHLNGSASQLYPYHPAMEECWPNDYCLYLWVVRITSKRDMNVIVKMNL